MSFEVKQRVLPEDHPDVARNVRSLKDLYYSIDKMKDAERYLSKLLASKRQALPDIHPVIAEVNNTFERVI